MSFLMGLVLATAMVGCSQTETPRQYVPKYSADQVITIVRAQYPTCFKQEWSEVDGRFRTLDTSSQISVQFVGGTSHAWKATITCPSGYHLKIGAGQARQWVVYFWETDGSLRQGYEK